MSKTFKEFAEACWDSHKQVGTKISSRTGKRVPNCVPKNEDNEQDELEERVKASVATRAKLYKPYDSSAQRATKLKVKNAISDLDHIAWQFENQFGWDSTSNKTSVSGTIASLKANSKYIQKVTNKIDSIMKELQSLERIL